MKLKPEIAQKYCVIAKNINLPENIHMAFVLGSGMSALFDNMNILQRISYNELFSINENELPGHTRELLILSKNEKIFLAFNGRFHYYEGVSIESICSQVLICHALSINSILFLNAAGGINQFCKTGDIMIIRDIIQLINVHFGSL
ncbi:MAG: hypothetical protein ACLFQX_06540, partial [Candidatus Kapaibacterium sp.]